jgi:membrane protease YdiL (CAAX protease family)
MTMKANTADRVARQSLAPFFLLTFLFSWLVAAPLALKAQGVMQLPLPFALHYLTGYGPMAAAFFLTARSDGWSGVRRLLSRMFHWRVSLVWWLFAFSPLLLYVFLAAGWGLLPGQPLALRELGQLNFLPDLGFAALPVWILTFGIGEETGWRGFALPRLRESHSPLAATVILWLFWSLWHLPMFFYAYETAIAPGMLLGLLAGALVFTWLYESSGGSILVVALWHGSFNFVTGCAACKIGLAAPIVSAAVMVWAIVLVIFYQTARPSGSEDGSSSTDVLMRN